ncbi:MAG TPA: FUSC family protein [Candidatus Cybelea sp.]|nr:FUSC family protein [Candidatus Cybelea sp.]
MMWATAPVIQAFRRAWVDHALRTSLAALSSVLVGGLLRLPETYWAAVTAMIVMQSTLGAALAVSWQRFAGTALGAAAGALLASYFASNLLVFTLGVFLLGLICGGLRLDRSAYRFASITLAIVMLIARTRPAWIVATHRFVEVSVGIAMGLLVTAVWPESTPGKPASDRTSRSLPDH